MVGIIFGKFFAKDNQVKNKEKDFFCLKNIYYSRIISTFDALKHGLYIN